MPEAEAVGDAVTGGLLGHAVEPHSGERDDGHVKEAVCLNCGCELAGAYCHCCGQRGHVHRTVTTWWHDFLHSVLHLDGKFWRTLPMLVWRPGELTRRYAHGERTKFISPLALFLFTVFLMFAVFSVAGPDLGGDLGLSEPIEEAIAEEGEKIQDLKGERATATGGEAAELEEQIEEVQQDIRRLETLRQRGAAHVPLVEPETGEDNTFFEAAFKKAQANPELLIYKMQANAYKFSWALIPLSVPFVWILFLHRRRYRDEFTAYDHLVFVTYSIAFMSVALVAYVLTRVAGVPGALNGSVFMLIPPIHMYRQLRGAYGLSRPGALWRTVTLLVFANVALSLFAMLLLLLGALG